MSAGLLAGADIAGGLAGGLMIGAAAAMLLLGLGRIAGVSGIAARATGLADEGMDRGVAWAFLLGLPLGAGVAASVAGWSTPDYAPLPVMLIAGLIVGLGTRMGSGCTSGHGVCGVSRLSPRSLAATGLFILSGILTVLAVKALADG